MKEVIRMIQIPPNFSSAGFSFFATRVSFARKYPIQAVGCYLFLGSPNFKSSKRAVPITNRDSTIIVTFSQYLLLQYLI